MALKYGVSHEMLHLELSVLKTFLLVQIFNFLITAAPY